LQKNPSGKKLKKERQLMAIMFTDIVGYTALMQKDEEAALAARERHREIFNEHTEKHQGIILQYFGDGTLSVFTSSINAVKAAIQIQSAFNTSSDISLRIGIHMGDILYDNEEIIGDSVNLASRIESIADPGSVFISEKIYDDIKNQVDIKTKYLGSTMFKNVKEPVSIYAVINTGLVIPDELSSVLNKSAGKNSFFNPERRSGYQEHHAFVSRTGELEKFKHQLHLLEKSKPGVMMISGSGGVGKSTLIQKGLVGIESVIIETKVFEEINTAFGPIINALRYIFNQLKIVDKRSLTLFDHLGLILPEHKKSGIETDNATLVAAVQEVFMKVSDQFPTIFLIEDIHWADAATLEILPKIMDMPDERPLIIITSYRSDHFTANQKLRWLKSELRRCKSYLEINLDSFGEEETSSFLNLLLEKPASQELVRKVYDRTFGLPLFIEEIAKTLKSGNLLEERNAEWVLRKDVQIPMPDSISDAISLQLDGLSSSTREVLEIAATIGQEFEFDLLFEIEPNGDAIDELLQQQFVSEIEAGKGAFRHSLVLDAIRNQILWSRRKSINFQVAEAMEKRKASPEFVSEFWMKAGEKERARKAYVLAATNYCGIHAYWDSAKLADKALDIWPKGDYEDDRIDLLLQYANCTKLIGQTNESILALREIIESPQLKDNFKLLASVYRSLASANAQQSQWHQYRKSRKSAAEYNEKAEQWDEASIDWRELANQYSDEINYSQALFYAEKAILCAQNSGNQDLIIRSLSNKSYTLSIIGKSQEALILANEALELAQSEKLIETAAYTYRKLAGVLEYSSKFGDSIQTYESTLAFCKREDLSLQAVFCLSCMSWVMFRLGDWSRALTICREIIEDKEVNEASRATALLVIGMIKAHRGENKSASKYINECQQIASTINYKLLDLLCMWAKGTIHDLDLSETEGYRYYTQLVDFWQSSEDKHDALGGIFSAVSFYADHNYKDEIIQCVSICATIAESTGNPEAIGVFTYTLGISSLVGRRYKEAADQLNESLKYFQDLEIPVQIALTQHFLGKIYLHMDERELGVIQLKQAIKLSKKLGMRPLSSKIEETLINIGEVVSDRRTSDHPSRNQKAGLTSRQYEILQAIAGGLSNKEIAGKLFLSTRTIDMHVRNIFDTLNCRNRTDAVKVAVDLGIL